MAKKKPKIVALREKMEEAKAACREAHLRGCRLVEEHRALRRELATNPDTAQRVHEIESRLRAVEMEMSGLERSKDRICERSSLLECEYCAQKRRLENAQRTLRVIQNPPPWGLGDYSEYEIAVGERRARKVVAELA